MGRFIHYVKQKLSEYSIFDYAFIGVFALSATFFIRRSMDLMMRRYWGIAIIIACLFVALRIASRYKIKKTGRLFLISTIPVVLLVIHIWFIDTFGSFDLGAILFHMTMGLEDGSVADLIPNTALYIAVGIVLLVSAHYIARRDIRLVYADRLLVLPLLLVSPLLTNIVSSYWHADDGDKLQTHYSAAPRDLKLADNVTKKNLIIINAESAERTFGALENGAEIFGDMQKIADQGISFVGVRQAANTGWTIAGLISSQCGVPLQPNGLFAVNKFEGQTRFMAGTVCLSGILKASGYQTSYVSSAATRFAGTNAFLKTHGYQHIDASENYENQWLDYRNFWGLYDDTMFDLAAKQVDQLTRSGEPYLLSISTISGHFPHGFPTQSCVDAFGPNTGKDMLYAIRCTGFEITRFLVRMKLAGQLDNTIVIVVSDHLSMKSSAWDELNEHDRMNFLTIIGMDRPAGIIEKNATMLDVYPTILEAMGFVLPNHQAGLGISLFSDKPTLVEQIGPERLDTIIMHDRNLRQVLWQIPETTGLTVELAEDDPTLQ